MTPRIPVGVDPRAHQPLEGDKRMAEITSETVKVHTLKITEEELASWRRAADKARGRSVEPQDGDEEQWAHLARLGLPPLRGM